MDATVRVLYDLEYPVKGAHTVSITQGELLYLIRKTNQDWWQVIRSGERRPFYVPRTYVKETNNTRSPGGQTEKTRGAYGQARRRKASAEAGEAVLLDGEMSRSLTDLARQITFRPRAAVSPGPPRGAGATHRRSWERRLDGLRKGGSLRGTTGMKPVRQFSGSWPDIRALDRSNNNCASDAGSETTATLSSTESIDPPRYRPVAKPRLRLQNQRQNSHGEVIYANCIELAKEIAARKSDSSVEHLRSTPDSDRGCSSGEESRWRGAEVDGDSDGPAPPRPAPRGWTTHIDTETQLPCYVHHATNQKWYASVDKEGREYYFEENGGESSWSLPELSESQVEANGSGSVDSSAHAEVDSGDAEGDSGDADISGDAADNSGDAADNSTDTPDGRGDSSHSQTPDIVSANTKMEDVMTSSIDTTQISEELSFVLQKISTSGIDPSRRLRNVKAFSMMIPDKRDEEINVNKNWPQLSEGKMYVVCEGPVQYTKVSEGGKKVRKSWSPAYVVLTELFLLVYKDMRAFHSLKTPPELNVDLNGAVVSSGEAVSGRKHVILVATLLGLKVALQCDNVNSALHWATNIQHTIQSLANGGVNCEKLLQPKALDGTATVGVAVLPGAGGVRVFSGQVGPECPEDQPRRTGAGIGRSKSVNFKCKDGDSLEELGGASATPQERQMKIRARLKKFFNKRPTMESLVKKGIWKDEPVFGCYLEQACGSNVPRIPQFVQKCIAVIESSQENMKTDGLYRASGNLSQIQKIRFQIDQHNYSCLEQEEDVHVLTGALKLFFRELKEPLIPYKLFEKAIKASTTGSKKERQNMLHDLVKALPMPNKDTLKFLLQHLLRVTQYQESNRMHVANVAIVFGPTLMWPEVESANMALDMMQQNMVIEALLNSYKTIFK